MPHHHYLIVGGGMAADTAVRGIRAVDPNGSVGLISAEPDPPYDRPPLTKGLWKDMEQDRVWRLTEDLEVDLLLGRRVIRLDGEDRTATDDRGTVHTWEKLLLATGGSPRLLPDAPPQVIHFRTWRDYLRVREVAAHKKRFAVIGGGFIGSELAAALAMNGRDVVMVFPEDGIGAKVFPSSHARFLNDYYRARGVDVRPQTEVAVVRRSGDLMLLAVVGPNGESETLRVDMVVAGLGITPAISLAESVGLEIEDGIVVDGSLRTAHPDIWAAGDVASVWCPPLGRRLRAEHEDQANLTGEQAGRAMAGEHVDLDHLPFFYSDLFDLPYEAVGVLDPSLEVVEDWAEPGRRGVLYYTDGGRVQGVLLWNVRGKLREARELIRKGEPRQVEEWRGTISTST
jgi:3-phenylpropionate/trans-cinnamate dioxygenase ferredoxin reductase subunit